MPSINPAMLGSLGNQPQVRSLLQMLGLQDPNAGGGGGVAPRGGGFVGGGGGAPIGGGGQAQAGSGDQAQQSYGTWAPRDWQEVPGLGEGDHGLFGGGALSPEDKARYFDQYGGYKMDDPQQVAADSGLSLAQLASGFLPRQGITGIGYEYGSDKGGFFNAQDMSRQLGRDVPGIATADASGPSTNNWRLLGMGPGWIMRNGELINTQAGGIGRGGTNFSDMGVGITGEHGMSAQRGSALGTGAAHGTPNQWGDSFYWPGAATGGFADRSPSGTNV